MRNNGPVTQREHVLPPGTTLVSTTDLESRITYCNPAFVEVSGFERSELMGQPHNIVRHPDMPAEAYRDMWDTLKAGQPWTALVKNRRKNGDHYWVRANVTPVLEGGRVNGYMSVRTAPGRDEVAAAEALYARMREEAAAGRLVHRLHRGDLQRAGAGARLARLLSPGLGARLATTACAGSAASVAAAVLLAPVSPWAAAVASLVIAAGAAAWLRSQALAPMRLAVASLRRMSAGDLSQVPAAGRQDEEGQLRRGLSQLNVNLLAIVGDVRREVEGITLASSEIARGNQDLGHRTESQASTGSRPRPRWSRSPAPSARPPTRRWLPPRWPAKQPPWRRAAARPPATWPSAWTRSASRHSASPRSSAPSTASPSRPTSWR